MTSVDDDYWIAAVHVRQVGGLVLSLQKTGYLAGYTAQYLVSGVDETPDAISLDEMAKPCGGAPLSGEKLFGHNETAGTMRLRSGELRSPTMGDPIRNERVANRGLGGVSLTTVTDYPRVRCVSERCRGAPKSASHVTCECTAGAERRRRKEGWLHCCMERCQWRMQRL